MSIYGNIGMISLDYIDEIQRLKNELKKREWISVKDRLPEENTVVLVHYDDGIICKAVYYDKHLKFMASDNITHWMPLPGSPERENEYHEEVQGIHQV